MSTPAPKPPERPDAPCRWPAWRPGSLWIAILGLIALVGMRDLFVATTQVQSIPYSEFVQHLKDGDVESVAVGAEFVEGRLKKPTPNGHTTTRRRDDLVRATEMARDIVARYGMSPEVGQVVYERPSSRFLELPPGVAAESRGISEDTQRKIDGAVRALVDEAFRRAMRVLTERRTLLEQGASELLAHETLTEGALRPLREAARRQPPPD